MRTTLTIEDQIAEELKARAFASGKSFKGLVNEALLKGLAAMENPSTSNYTLKPAAMGQVRNGADLTKAIDLAQALEDEELVRKLDLRK